MKQEDLRALEQKAGGVPSTFELNDELEEVEIIIRRKGRDHTIVPRDLKPIADFVPSSKTIHQKKLKVL